MDLSEKQFRTAMHHARPERFMIAIGAAGSGKTFCVALSFSIWLLSLRESFTHLITGWTISSVWRNQVKTVQSILISQGANIINSRSGFLVQFGGLEQTVEVIGADSKSARPRIQGATYAGIVVDEVTVMQQDYWTMLWSRLRSHQTKIWATANPKHNRHWFKVLIVDNLEKWGARQEHFLLKDNPSLSAEYIESMEALKGTVDYSRLVLGQWVSDEGLIFQDPPVELSPPITDADECICGLDWAGSGTFAAILLARFGKQWFVVSERIHNARTMGALHETEQVRLTMDWICSLTNKPTPVVGDPTTPTAAKEAFEERSWWIDAMTSVYPGIYAVKQAFAEGNLKIDPSCDYLLDEMASYSWDQSSQERGESVPVKRADHACDSLRYAWVFVSTRLNVDEIQSDAMWL